MLRTKAFPCALSEARKCSWGKGKLGLQSKLGGVVKELTKTIPQSATLTALFTQGSLIASKLSVPHKQKIV